MSIENLNLKKKNSDSGGRIQCACCSQEKPDFIENIFNPGNKFPLINGVTAPSWKHGGYISNLKALRVLGSVIFQRPQRRDYLQIFYCRQSSVATINSHVDPEVKQVKANRNSPKSNIITVSQFIFASSLIHFS